MITVRNIAIAVVAIILVIVASRVPYAVGQSQQAVLLEFGHVRRIETTPGLHFKWPFVERARRFSTRVLTLNASPQNYTTKDGDNVSVDYFLKWRIKDVKRFFQNTGGSLGQVRNALSQQADSTLRKQVSQHTLTQLVAQDDGDTDKAVLKALQSKVSGMGVGVLGMHVRRINLPDSVSKSIYARMKSAQEQLAKHLRAQGAEQAQTIRAKAQHQRSDILAQAYRKAEEIRGEGDAQAAKIYAGAYGKDPEFYRFYRSLQIYRDGWKDKHDRLVLEPGSPLLQYFNAPSVKH